MTHPTSARRGGGLGPTDFGLLAAPLDFISEDHLRARQICAMVDALAMSGLPDQHAALTALRFVNEELNVHLRNEVEDLFPLLLRRCTDEDSIAAAISRIRADQDEAEHLLPQVRMRLAACHDTGADLTAEGRAVLIRFAHYLRRHLVAENAIPLAIARARLTRDDRRVLSEHMRARRGPGPPTRGIPCGGACRMSTFLPIARTWT